MSTTFLKKIIFFIFSGNMLLIAFIFRIFIYLPRTWDQVPSNAVFEKKEFSNEIIKRLSTLFASCAYRATAIKLYYIKNNLSIDF